MVKFHFTFFWRPRVRGVFGSPIAKSMIRDYRKLCASRTSSRPLRDSNYTFCLPFFKPNLCFCFFVGFLILKVCVHSYAYFRCTTISYLLFTVGVCVRFGAFVSVQHSPATTVWSLKQFLFLQLGVGCVFCACVPTATATAPYTFSRRICVDKRQTLFLNI